MDYWERKRRLPFGEAARIAARLGVTPSCVSHVLRDGKGSRRVMRAIARAIKVPVAEAFPTYASITPRIDEAPEQEAVA